MKVAVSNVPWPAEHPLLHPVDSVPPATVILSPQPDARVAANVNTLTIKGVTMDQNRVTSVLVNGVPASINPNGLDWTVTLTDVTEGVLTVTAGGTDDSGNQEQMPHSIEITVGASDNVAPSAPMALNIQLAQ